MPLTHSQHRSSQLCADILDKQKNGAEGGIRTHGAETILLTRQVQSTTMRLQRYKNWLRRLDSNQQPRN